MNRGFCRECVNFRKAPIVFAGGGFRVEERDCRLFKHAGYMGTGAVVTGDYLMPCENFTPYKDSEEGCE